MEEKVVYAADRLYPARLRELAGMPRKLYVRGTLPKEERAVAIVGARGASPYGKQQAYALAAFCARRGIAVVSGMAEGVDSAAARGALGAGGRTYAVLGCGTDICYPSSSRDIYREIPKSGGLVSEFPAGTPPLKTHFPARNRIISALADAVVVVEARERSGSLITADFALEQGRTVMAFPGRVGDGLSEGTNRLIAQGAAIITKYEDVLFELGLPPCGEEAGEKRLPGDPGPEDPLLGALSFDPMTADELAEKIGTGTAYVRAALIRLLLEGSAEECGPGLYVRKGNSS